MAGPRTRRTRRSTLTGNTGPRAPIRLGVRETVVRRMLDPDRAPKLASIERTLAIAQTPVYLVMGGLKDLRKPSSLSAAQISRSKAGKERPFLQR